MKVNGITPPQPATSRRTAITQWQYRARIGIEGMNKGFIYDHQVYFNVPTYTRHQFAWYYWTATASPVSLPQRAHSHEYIDDEWFRYTSSANASLWYDASAEFSLLLTMLPTTAQTHSSSHLLCVMLLNFYKFRRVDRERHFPRYRV